MMSFQRREPGRRVQNGNLFLQVPDRHARESLRTGVEIGKVEILSTPGQRLTDKRVGLLINFNVSYLTKGVRRIVNKF